MEEIKALQEGRTEIKQGLTGHAKGIRFNPVGQLMGSH